MNIRINYFLYALSCLIMNQNVIALVLCLYMCLANLSLQAQTLTKSILYTKSCDTVSVDSMVCIKCSNPELTLNCKRYVCDFQNHCIEYSIILVNKQKNIKTPKIVHTKKL